MSAIVATTGDKALVGRYAELLSEGGRVASMRGGADAAELSRRGIMGVNVQTALNTAELERLAGLFESGAIRPPAIKEFRLDAAGDAIAELAGGHARGKVVVIP